MIQFYWGRQQRLVGRMSIEMSPGRFLRGAWIGPICIVIWPR